MSNPLVALLVRALRDAGNAIGEPIAGYYPPEMKLDAHQRKEAKVARIIARALLQLPAELKELEDTWTAASCAMTDPKVRTAVSNAVMVPTKFRKPSRGSKSSEELPATREQLEQYRPELTKDQIEHALKFRHSVGHIRWAQMH